MSILNQSGYKTEDFLWSYLIYSFKIIYFSVYCGGGRDTECSFSIITARNWFGEEPLDQEQAKTCMQRVTMNSNTVMHGSPMAHAQSIVLGQFFSVVTRKVAYIGYKHRRS